MSVFKTRVDSRLQRIANVLLLNAGFMSSSGLYSGKTGVAIFLYRYARHTGNDVYSGYAGALIDAVYEEIAVNTPVDFKDGLAGIGWGIEYLVKHGFLEADTDQVLEEVDQAIYRAGMTAPSLVADSGNLFGHGLYYLARLQNGHEREDLTALQKKEQLVMLADECERLFVHRGFSDLHIPSLHIGVLNSVLFFLLEMQRLALFPARVEKLIRYMPLYIGMALRTSRDDVARHCMMTLATQVLNRIPDRDVQDEYHQVLARYAAPQQAIGENAVAAMTGMHWNELLYAPYIDPAGPFQDPGPAFDVVDDEADWNKRLMQCAPGYLGLNGLAGIGQALLSRYPGNSHE